MNISAEIYNLQSQKGQLEFAFVEEQYHYESIPKRRAITRSKAMLCLFFAIPVTLFILSYLSIIIYTILHPDVSFAGFVWLLTPPVIIFVGATGIRLWSIWFNEMGLLHGRKKKSLNYGSTNYSSEEIASHDKLTLISEKIVDLDNKIKELKSMRTYEQAMADRPPEERSLMELSDEEFFTYAYGHWGDTRDDLLYNMSTGKYEAEVASLESRIATEKDILNNIAHIKSRIITEYEKTRNRFLLYLISILLLALIQIAILSTIEYPKKLIVIAIIYGVVGLLVTGPVCFKKRMAYLVEFDYEKVTQYAEENKLEPTEFIRKRSMNKIKDYMNRLEYDRRLLDYKVLHNIGPEEIKK